MSEVLAELKKGGSSGGSMELVWLADMNITQGTNISISLASYVGKRILISFSVSYVYEANHNADEVFNATTEFKHLHWTGSQAQHSTGLFIVSDITASSYLRLSNGSYGTGEIYEIV